MERNMVEREYLFKKLLRLNRNLENSTLNFTVFLDFIENKTHKAKISVSYTGKLDTKELIRSRDPREWLNVLEKYYTYSKTLLKNI